MKCVEAQRLMRAYAEGSLPDRETEEFLDHVEKCRDCYEELELYLLVQTTMDPGPSRVSAPAFSMERQIGMTRNAIHRRKVRRMMFLFGTMLVVILGAGIFRLGLIRRMFRPAHRKTPARIEKVVPEAATEDLNETFTETVTESIHEPMTGQETEKHT